MIGYFSLYYNCNNIHLQIENWFFFSTYNKLRERCRQHMVGDHLKILHGECEAMIKEERRDDMHNIYLLLREVKDGMNSLVDIFREHIKQHGIKVIESLKQEQVFFY
jgi:cullin 2